MSNKKRFGDRKDAKLIRNVDSMHFVMPIIFPNRCDNEAFISERIDLTNLNKFLEKKNGDNPEYKYNLFQVIITATLKTIYLRPKMNIFIANKRMYQRNDITAAFVVKKLFTDDAQEAMATIKAKPGANIDTIHDEIYKRVTFCRTDSKGDSTQQLMDILNVIPRFISNSIISFICFLEKRGWAPSFVTAGDPYYSTVLLSNLGSIKLRCGYHHLSNWGTTSVFIVVGEKKIRPFYDENGNVEMRDSVDIGLTVDERIADGYYFSKTVRLLKTLLENPELLEKPIEEEVDY